MFEYWVSVESWTMDWIGGSRFSRLAAKGSGISDRAMPLVKAYDSAKWL